jgi:hypothetical protein
MWFCIWRVSADAVDRILYPHEINISVVARALSIPTT